MGKGDLRSEFTTKLIDEPKGAYVLELTPKKGTGHYKKLILIVNAATFFVEQTVVYDPTGNTNHIVFGKVETGTGLDPKLFVFDVPPGVKVIEMK